MYFQLSPRTHRSPLRRLAGLPAIGRGRAVSREFRAVLQLALHLWLVAVFPVSHALSDEHGVSAPATLEALADNPGACRVGDASSGDGHSVPCVFCRVITSPLWQTDPSVVLPGEPASDARAAWTSVGLSSSVLAPPVARGPPPLIG